MSEMMATDENHAMSLIEPQSLENPEHREAIEKANNLIIQGKTQATRDGAIEACCSMMAEACELYAKIFGEVAPQCVHPYMYYASALLDLGRKEHGVVSVDQAKERQEVATTDETPENAASNEEANDDDMETEEPEKIPEESTAERESDSESEKADGEEDESNLRHALTIFDIAIMICDKNLDENRFKIDKADCLLKKSEILQEFDDFQQALMAVQESLYLQATISPAYLRMRAESLYYLGMIFQNMENYQKASEAYQRCISSLQERITEITSPGFDASQEKIESEVSEIKDLMEEINIKLVDVKMSADERLRDHVKAALASGETKKVCNDNLKNQVHVDMTSRLVRKPTMDNGSSQADAMDM